MHITINTELIQLIRESEVLAGKLSPPQLEKFIEASLSLSPERQSELTSQLKSEQEKMRTVRKNALEEYEKTVSTLVKHEKQTIEKISRKNEQEKAENLLQNL